MSACKKKLKLAMRKDYENRTRGPELVAKLAKYQSHEQPSWMSQPSDYRPMSDPPQDEQKKLPSETQSTH